MNLSLKNQINKLIAKRVPFALYFLPGESELSFVSGKLSLFDTSSQDASNPTGFVFAPYKETLESPSLLIEGDYAAQGSDAIMALIQNVNGLSSEAKKIDGGKIPQMSQTDFETIVDKAVNEIQQSDSLQKVVLSRAKNIELSKDFDAVALLEKMQLNLPLAFCYLCYIPGHGTWMGATPERLLEVNGRRAQTNALAGTLRNGTKDKWSQKEKDEQQIVTDYIADLLLDVGITNYNIEGPAEIASGSVRHLRSVFTFDLDTDVQLLSVMKALHPTPAICGMPKVEADIFIAENENYNREYYSGYLGPLGLNDASHIFVNLRCMKIVEDSASLFVGAGITSGSKPLKEWEETGVKALTLLNVIRN